MIWGVLILAMTLAGKLAYDYKKHMAGKTINHRKEAVIAFILIVVASLAAAGKWDTWNDLLYLPCFLSIFWAGMDTGFGLLIARDPFFLGNSAWLDRLQKSKLKIKKITIPTGVILQVSKYLAAIASIIILFYA